MKNGTFVSQGKYIKDMIKKFGLQDAKPMSTPMGTNDQLGVDASGNMVDQKQYRSMIESLLYVTASRPDVILRYLKGTHDVGLWFLKGSNFELIGYLDSDYGGCKIDRMSTSGTCQLLGRSLVSWSLKKQNSVALSTVEAEYISVGSCCAQLFWIKATLNDFRIKFKNVPLFCDNKSAIKMTQNPVQHSRTKHINIRHHFIRDYQQKGDISIESIFTEDQLADIFTKPLDEKRFYKLKNELNILDFSNLK
jgi:hypothetical protein